MNEMTEYSGEWWANEIALTEKTLDKKWRESADTVVNRYLDDREEDSLDDNSRKYNIFWANTQILKSALYATPPKPTVSREFGDAKDDIARTAALILQRILSFGLEKDESDMHEAFLNATEDRLIPGLGQVWLRYEVETEKYKTEPILSEDGQVIVPSIEAERITNEEVCTDYVHWRDFLWGACRTWREVPWVARRLWMRKKKFIKRFGEEKYKDIKREVEVSSTAQNGYPEHFKKGKVQVIEIWCEDTNKVYFLNPDTKIIVEEKEDPMKLEGFYPCPPPLLATHATKDVTPRPDYVMAQDQYEELDILNARISSLTKALRVVGAYDATNGALSKLLTGPELSMIAVEKWAMMAEAGGIKGVVDWFPVENVANVLKNLVEQRILVVQQIYELTSISDIIRGSTNPRETLGAQKMKAQYSSVRLRLVQQDVAKFVCRCLRIKAEIISKHFQPETIAKVSLIEETESAQFAPQAIQLLKDYGAAKYRIKVSEESLSMADYTAEREMRIEYLTAVGQFLSQAGGITEAVPQALPYLIKMITWVTASFRGGDDIESVLDEAAKMAQQLPPPQQAEKEPPPPDHALEVENIKAGVKKYEVDENNKTKLIIADRDREDKAVERDFNESGPIAESAIKGFSEVVEPLVQAISMQAEISQDLKDAISLLAAPRKRIPVRDKTGNILYVNEVRDE